MITILGWHGYLSPKLSAAMDSIAKVVVEKVEWEFDGSVGDFSDKWGMPFLVYPQIPSPDEDRPTKLRRNPTDPKPTGFVIYITDHPSYQAR